MTDPVEKSRTAFWRCLYTQGHDAALLTPISNGWKLTGTAVFRDDNGPVSAGYSVEMDEAWGARRGAVAGFSDGRHFRHDIEKTAEGWMLDGRPNGLVELPNLDFGFTPATNFQQLRRANLRIGERAEFSVAWFDIGRGSPGRPAADLRAARRYPLLVRVAHERLSGYARYRRQRFC